jgi:hypothetical protein
LISNCRNNCIDSNIAIAVFLIKVVVSFIVSIIILTIIADVELWIYGKIEATQIIIDSHFVISIKV